MQNVSNPSSGFARKSQGGQSKSTIEPESAITLCGKPVERVMQVHASDNLKHWYDRAAQMRELAEAMGNDEAKRIMLKIAEGYDRLGDRAAERHERV